MQSDIAQRLLAWSPLVASGYQVPAASQTMDEAAAEIARLTEAHNRNMADHGRLLWKDEAQSVCPSADICFEYGDTVRCGPCAIKLAEGAGVEPNMQLPNLPEVSRLSRENERLTSQLRAADEREKALREDADRYHWLRDHSCPPHNFYISVPDEFAGQRYGPNEVDAYIDAAYAALKEQPHD